MLNIYLALFVDTSARRHFKDIVRVGTVALFILEEERLESGDVLCTGETFILSRSFTSETGRMAAIYTLIIFIFVGASHTFTFRLGSQFISFVTGGALVILIHTVFTFATTHPTHFLLLLLLLYIEGIIVLVAITCVLRRDMEEMRITGETVVS